MPFKIVIATLIICCSLSCVAPAAEPPPVDRGRWSDPQLAQIIGQARRLDSAGARILALSGHFLDTPYVAGTLIGAPHTAEQLVINLAGFDCFTFLDVVEALRRATDPTDFPGQLQQVRYRGGVVRYENRRHFFSDWVTGDSAVIAGIADVSAALGAEAALTVVKRLNLKQDGSHWLPGIPVTRREISYIPSEKLNRELLAALQGGDYLGIYTDQAGLDVSHTGLLVKEGDRLLLRHASSRPGLRRVVDVDLLEYLRGKPGLVVYRVIAEVP